ncbi:MAG: MFS transporter, partial [Brevundimonas sp.]
MNAPTAAARAEARRGWRFFVLYGVAVAAGVVSYAPFLTLLLPIKIEGLAEDKIHWLSMATLLGAVVASLTNIGAGWLSDISLRRGIGRRRWMQLGLVATLASYAVLWLCQTPVAVVAGVVLFQAAVNLMLAPLSALIVDETPDAQKGLAAGVAASVYPIGMLAGVVVTAWPAMGEGTQFLMIGAAVTLGLLPFTLRRAAPPIVQAAPASAAEPRSRQLGRVWLARLLIQVAGNILFAYVYFYFESVAAPEDPGAIAGRVALLSAVVAAVGAPAALFGGRLSDLAGTRRPFLAASAALATGALFLMADSSGWAMAAVGYGLFSVSANVFLAVSSAYVMQRLPSPHRRGRDMGVLNLTNTLPA